MVVLSATQCPDVGSNALTGSICCDRCVREKALNNTGGVDLCYRGVYCNACPPETFRNLKTCQCEPCTACSSDSEQIRTCHTTGDALCLKKSELSSRESLLLTSKCCEQCFIDKTSTSGLVFTRDSCSGSNMCNACPSRSFRRSDDCLCYACSTCKNGDNVTKPCTETSNTVCSPVTSSTAPSGFGHPSRLQGLSVSVFVSILTSFQSTFQS